MARLNAALALTILFATCRVASAQAQAPQSPSLASALVSAEPSAEAFTFRYVNRPIVVFRARVLGRSPADRARSAELILDDLVSQHISGPVASQAFPGGALIVVGSQAVLGLTTLDIDELAGQTLQGVADETVARLQQAVDEALEARSTGLLLRNGAAALAGLAVGLLALWGISRAHRLFAGKLTALAEKSLARTGFLDAEVVRASRLLDFQRGLVTTAIAVLDLLVVYATLSFVLRRLPYTRPWGESMRGFMLATIENLALGVANAIPGLFTVALIALITRFLIRLVGLWFTAVEQGRVRPRWLYPETAQPTRRLVTTLLWLFAIVVAYPYMPGSQTDAFKGVSVFLGLMVTFGSSGLVNQIMSGFMLTYSRAVRVGDFVKIADVEGTVIHLGILSTKIRTPWNEDVTIPNTVVVSQTTTDYSRFGDTEGVYTPTSVTIGYDTPWRQVQAMLLEAAERTPGVRREPHPMVLQAGLEDFYVKYTLFVCLERQSARPFVLHTLHANIQDLFNEHGVQIMSPNYIVDPAAPKVVPKAHWYQAPARADRQQPVDPRS